MGKFSKIFNYISKEDLKRAHEQKVCVEKLESERIKEERRQGLTIQSAIHNGFNQAFRAIIDANTTTLIAAIVLFILFC